MIEKEFRTYLAMAYPNVKFSQMPSDQVIELRRAFYAGIWYALNKSELENQYLVDECKKFKQDVLEGKK